MADIDKEIALIAKINEATQCIPDEETRKLAFKTLLERAGLGEAIKANTSASSEKGKKARGSEEKKPKRVSKKGNSGSKRAPDIDPELDLEPNDKQPFETFADKRDLKSHKDKICASVYYLRNVLSVDAVGAAQVATCFKAKDWDWPADFKNQISQCKTARRLVYESMDDLRLTATETNSMKKETKRD